MARRKGGLSVLPMLQSACVKSVRDFFVTVVFSPLAGSAATRRASTTDFFGSIMEETANSEPNGRGLKLQSCWVWIARHRSPCRSTVTPVLAGAVCINFLSERCVHRLFHSVSLLKRVQNHSAFASEYSVLQSVLQDCIVRFASPEKCYPLFHRGQLAFVVVLPVPDSGEGQVGQWLASLSGETIGQLLELVCQVLRVVPFGCKFLVSWAALYTA